VLYLTYEKRFFVTSKLSQLVNSLKISDADFEKEEAIAVALADFSFSLNKVLPFVNMTVQTFLKTTNKLIEMLSVPREMHERLVRLESNLNVSTILFSKYKTMFADVFDCRDDINSSQLLVFADWNLKVVSGKTSLFKFGWLLFIYIKSRSNILLMYFSSAI
jgi:hypothetical protein